MADAASIPKKRSPLKASGVGTAAARRRKEMAVMVGKERREAFMRSKRLCRVGVGNEEKEVSGDGDDDIVMDEELNALEEQAAEAVEALKCAVSYQGKGVLLKKVNALRDLRRILSKSEYPPVEAVLNNEGVPALVQCLSFGSPDEQLLEAAWCLTNIAAGKLDDVKALLPALPLLIAHVGEKSSPPVAEQCAWALGNIAAEGQDVRSIMLLQGALPPLSKLILSSKGSTVRTAAWALSNLLKGPDPTAATKLIKFDGVLDAILRHLTKGDDELVTEVAWVVVYLTALSNFATSILTRSSLPSILVERLASSDCIPLLIPMLRSLGNLLAADSYLINDVLVPGREIAANMIQAITKCLQSENRALQKESAWVLSNLAAGSIDHKRLILHSSEVMASLVHLFSAAAFDVRKEAGYVLGNLCVVTDEGGETSVVTEHLIFIVGRGCIAGFVALVRSPDTEAAMMGLQFLELVLRGMPNSEGSGLVEAADGIDAMERFQFHENDHLRNMANMLVDKYFGVDYGLDS